MSLPLMDDWRTMSDAQRTACARSIAASVGRGLSFRELRRFAQSKESMPIAVFLLGGSEFVLIPGGVCTLGFDPSNWTPLEHEPEVVDDAETPFETVLEQWTSRPRSVCVQPFLVETVPWDVAWTPVASEDPEARRLYDEMVKHSWRGLTEGQLRVVRRNEGGSDFVADRKEQMSVADVEGRLAKQGYRLLATDEWEYLCGAGASTLFRWGDHCPNEREHDRHCVDMQILRRDVRLTGAGALRELESERWKVQQRRNAFGVVIAFDANQGELVQRGEVRAVDVGGFQCSGATALLAWLPLATSFVPRAEWLGDRSEVGPDDVARRVLSL